MTRAAQPLPAVHAQPLLEPGRNCWRVERSSRTRCIQDAAEYFRIARAAILRAEHSVFILGWDIYASLDLLPGVQDAEAPTRLAELLDFVVRRRRDLHCYVLVWDHAALYSLERDPFTRLKFGWLTHHRVHFRFDDQTPVGASHHEKLLVVDDMVAFAGGVDFTSHRWDTSAHEVEEPRRLTPLGKAYEPYHDVQIMVEGPAAAALGELARTRWQRIGWRRLPPVAGLGRSPWPDDVPSDLPEVQLGIARTQPAFRGRSEVRECEQLFFDSIAAARRSIYVENQYFTDARIGRALAARLREPDGPELIVIGPRQCSGWLERHTMGVLRRAITAELVAADRHGRLRLLHAVASQRASVCTFIHSKVMVVDDELLRIGSANLAARSMGMDGECDLVAIAGGAVEVQSGIARIRDRLLAEHLGVSEEEAGLACGREGSLVRAIDSLSGGDRTLLALEPEPVAGPEVEDTVRSLVDPAEPMAVVATFGAVLPELEASENRSRRMARILPVVVLTAAALIVWRAHWLGEQDARATGDLLRNAPASLPAVFTGTIAFVLAGLAFVPLHLVILLTAIVFGPFLGFAITVVGTAISLALGYRIGGWLGPERLATWIGHRVYRLLRTLHRPGASSIAALRLVPVASSTTVNLLCGAAVMPAGDFWRGSLLGLLPPSIALCVTGWLLRRGLLQHEPWTAGLGVAFGLLLVAIMLRWRRRLLQQHVDVARRSQEERSLYG